MPFRQRMLPRSLVFASSLGLALLSIGTNARAQDSGFEMHAHGKITARDIGLPAYPGAQLFKEKESDPTVDLGFTFGDTHFRILAAKYTSSDTSQRILDFYRKPLSRYGEVLECDHGKPVGKLQSTASGLTCDGGKGDKSQLYGNVDSSDDLELRAGTPHKFRIVGLSPQKDGQTHFGLVYVELPQDRSSNHSD